MRPIHSLLLASFVLVAPATAGAQQTEPRLSFIRPPDTAAADAFRGYRQEPYRAIRPGEVRAAAFLTGTDAYHFGRVLGPVEQTHITAIEGGAFAARGSTIGVKAPEGSAYAAGDTVVVAELRPAPRGWGQMVVPTGLARVIQPGDRQTTAEVIAVFGAISRGQVTLPATPITDRGVEPIASPNGPSGTVIGERDSRMAQQPGGILFTDIGQSTGIRLGDFVEVRRKGHPRAGASDTVDEVVAVAQVVSVTGRTSSIKLLRVISADIPTGTSVVRVATQPG